jgi:hypothetical protein
MRASLINLERPSFGQCARQVLGLHSEELASCLDQQLRQGARLGEVFRHRGIATREQIAEILKLQARWIATGLQADMQPAGFPHATWLSLCMPAYNEAANIEDTLDAACAILPEFVRRFEIIVVDDGSQDDTAEQVARYAAREPRVRLVRHEQNRGYGAAVSTGLRAAAGDLVAFTDSDGQFTLLDLPQLLMGLDGCDVVVGYRYQRADNWLRRLNARAWGWLIRTVLGVRVKDLDCAFKLFPRRVIDDLQLTTTGAAINAEILAQCTQRGYRIREFPVTHYPRYHGSPTGAARRVILKAFRELPRLWRYRGNSNSADKPNNPLPLEPDLVSAASAGVK